MTREKIDCFLPEHCRAQLKDFHEQLCASNMVRNVFWSHGMNSTADIVSMARQSSADYVLMLVRPTTIVLGYGALERFVRVAADSQAAMAYADRFGHPAIDYQAGAIRDDFDFGALILVNGRLLRTYAAQTGNDNYRWAGLYAFRLFLSREGQLVHLSENLYTEEELDHRTSGEKQFDYVNPRNREVQLEMERAATEHLAAIGAKIDPSCQRGIDFQEQEFYFEASVIIPVYNREKTIADAVNSALGQNTSFRFNVIVVDNHSTDGTTEILRTLAADSRHQRTDGPALLHLIPERNDLAIGGCWNVAVNDPHCGRFAVQLDSDDIYSSPDTLQRMVDAFYQQQAAMVVGSYRMCDFELNTLPPGLIDHREWTDENGMNNALRINGLGAPRAFFTPLLRQLQFPNTSYGEDYALGLAFSRHYRIGRIFDELYLCRRWGGNSDAALSVEKVNANNLYKDRLRTLEIEARQHMTAGMEDNAMPDAPLERFFDRQLRQWDETRIRYRQLNGGKTRELNEGASTIVLQWNPARMVSTGAKIDKETLECRPCFLCAENRPKEQMKRTIGDRLELLVNPFPILPMHFTLPTLTHTPQAIKGLYGEMYRLLENYPRLMVFYNGPRCGASAPDHAHLQAGVPGTLPLIDSWQRLSRSLTTVVSLKDDDTLSVINDYPCPALLIRSHSRETGGELFRVFYKAFKAMGLQKPDEEPMMNIVAWRKDDEYMTVVFPREKHRPDCYGKVLVSPGAIDMAGLMITPREEDFEQLTAEQAFNLLREVALSRENFDRLVELMPQTSCKLQWPASKEPVVSVGVVSGRQVAFSLNAPYTAKGDTFTGEQLVEFSEGAILWHGQLYKELLFTPQADNASFSLHNVTIGMNFHWERKQTQQFNGTLRLVVESDHIVAINEIAVESYLTSVIFSEMSATSSTELLKAHAVISRSWLLAQMEKRREMSKKGGNSFFSFTKKDDELIRWYDREDHTVFDVCADDHCQRYQGITHADNPAVVEAIKATRGQILTYRGQTERGYEICDTRFSKCCGGQTEEFQYCWENLSKPYLTSVPCTYCNTNDKHILSQVLNDYDQETPDFYRWTVEYSQEELTELVNRKLKVDLGEITDLVPLERGKSGRIWRLKIVGTKKSFTIGKELEIRRALSESHLYSSAFDVEKIGGRFVLHGKGWGHGVGLCQIGAAVMGEEGKKYSEILLYYYRGAEIKKIYE